MMEITVAITLYHNVSLQDNIMQCNGNCKVNDIIA